MSYGKVKLVLKQNRYFVESTYPVSGWLEIFGLILLSTFPCGCQDVFQQFLRDPVIQETRKMPDPESEELAEDPLLTVPAKPLTVSTASSCEGTPEALCSMYILTCSLVLRKKEKILHRYCPWCMNESYTVCVHYSTVWFAY